MPLSSADLLRDIRAEFTNTYNTQATVSPNLSACMALGITSTKREEHYGYHESTPGLERWDRGEDMPEDEILSKSFSVVNYSFAKAIGFYEDDVEDMQLAGFREAARRVATKGKILPERMFFQIMRAAANAQLLQAIPNAPDGAALYAATAGGAARFGATGGNIVTGSGVASAAAIRTDFWDVMERFGAFQDTEGEPLLEDELDGSIVVVAPRSASEVFTEAFKQERTIQIVENQAGSENVGGAAVSNSIRAGNLNVKLWFSQRITDNDWSVFIDSPTVPKPIFEQIRQAMRVIEENRNNSRAARRSKRHAILADMRAGYGVALPYGTIKVNN